MVETLAGSISEMSLLEILKLLNSGRMNGRLTVTNSIDQGHVYVKHGQIIHCAAGENVGEHALISMLGWMEGRFKFDNDVEAGETTIEKTTEQILLDGARKVKDWESIKKVIPSMSAVFALLAESSTGAVNLQPNEWQILSQVDGKRTIKEIVEITGKDEFEVAKILFQLHSSGLLDKVELPQNPVSNNINENFFNHIETELTKAIGPLASIIIDDTIEDLGESRSTFPGDKIATLVEKVSNEISDENKKLQFSQTIIESLKDFENK